MANELSLKEVKSLGAFDLYQQLILGKKLTFDENVRFLEVAVIFFNSSDKNVRRLGYRMVLLYSIRTGDFVPLYDLSTNLGYFPISKRIGSFLKDQSDPSFFRTFHSAYFEAFREREIYMTRQQRNVHRGFANKSASESTLIVAPTSYGKSQLIMDSLESEKNTCILVPTKALVAQTKRRILQKLDNSSTKRIVTHPDMLGKEHRKIIAILTQERLIRTLLQHPELQFDTAFVDEAHNLLDDSDRARLLASAIILLKGRNDKLSLNFLTPFLETKENLQTMYSKYELKELRVSEYVKSEIIHYCEFRKNKEHRFELQIYDQFYDHFFHSERYFKNPLDLIFKRSSSKNIIYHNRPSVLEKFVRTFIRSLPKASSPALDREIEAIRKYVHRDYLLVESLEKGVVYHHGSVPDNIKNFIEKLFCDFGELKYIVTNSTLLEGVNIPAEKIFLMSYKRGNRKLSPFAFRNLIGRVCRFSEVFDGEDMKLRLLLPEIYVVGSEYAGKADRMDLFIKNSMKIDKKISDEPKNLLLEASEEPKKPHERRIFNEFLESVAPNTTKDPSTEKARSELGKACFQHGIVEFDVVRFERQCSQELKDLLKGQGRLTNAQEILSAVESIFLRKIHDEDRYGDLLSLKRPSVLKFYTLILAWRIEATPFAKMIAMTLQYWKKRGLKDPIVYVGKWGEIKNNGHMPEWIDLRQKSENEKVNLAVVRVKEAQDFLENNILKFVEVLNDCDTVEAEIYLKIKYGTTNLKEIALIRAGIGPALGSLLLKKYSKFVNIDIDQGTVLISADLIPEMTENDENGVLLFEARLNVTN